MKTLPTKPAPQHFHGKPVAPQAEQGQTCKPAAPLFHGHPVAPNDKPEAPGTAGKPAPYLRHKPGFGGPIYKGGDVFKADSFKAGAATQGLGQLAQGRKVPQGGEKLGAELSKLGQEIGAIDKGLAQLEGKLGAVEGKQGPTEGKPEAPKGKPGFDGAVNEKATPSAEAAPHVEEAFTK